MSIKSTILMVLAATSAMAQDDNSFQAPGSTDRRSPCPMVNTIANHGYLPRDGLNITMADLITGFNASVNLASTATQLVGAKALLTSTTGSNTSFNLDDLKEHGVIEHDGSLSRADIYFGDNHSFNSTIWDSVMQDLSEEYITITIGAKARAARLARAKADNPEFNMTASDLQSSLIETALYLSIMNDSSAEVVSARKEWVHVLFAEERLPIEEGWTRPSEEISIAGILAKVTAIAAVNTTSETATGEVPS